MLKHTVKFPFILLFLLSIFALPSLAEKVDLNNGSLKDFVGWYSAKTGKSVIIKPGLSASLTVFSADINKENIDSFFVSVLRANGFDTINGVPLIVTKLSSDAYSSNNSFMSSSIDPDKVLSDASSSGRLADDSNGSFFNSKPPLITKFYSIHNVRAQDLSSVVSVFLKSFTQVSSSVVPVDGANALVVTAPAIVQQHVASFIPSVDVPRDQVLIEGLMFETSTENAFDFSFSAGSNRGTIAGGINTDRLGSVLSSAGGSFGIFNGNILGLSLQAVQNDTSTKVLSVPRILTMSGQNGYLSVGQNVPFVTGKVTGEAANVNNPFQTIERHDVGVSLSVTPVVTPTGLIIMTIHTKADSISNISSASDIITNQRQIDTTVDLKSGQTLLLGGLIDNHSSKSDSSVPFLSKIPLLGWLFKSKSDDATKRTLYVLIRAQVLRTI